jgi:hypothetical protein
LLLLPGGVLLLFFGLASGVVVLGCLHLLVLEVLLSILLVSHRGSISILLSKLVLLSSSLHSISSVVVTDVVLSVVESIRGSLVELTAVFGLRLNLLLLAHAFRALRTVSRVA